MNNNIKRRWFLKVAAAGAAGSTLAASGSALASTTASTGATRRTLTTP